MTTGQCHEPRVMDFGHDSYQDHVAIVYQYPVLFFRYILNQAVDNGGVIVSNDHYRELISVKKEYKKVIEESILMFTFVDDKFMPPDDPYGSGRHGPNGPSLDNFLKVKT